MKIQLNKAMVSNTRVQIRLLGVETNPWSEWGKVIDLGATVTIAFERSTVIFNVEHISALRFEVSE